MSAVLKKAVKLNHSLKFGVSGHFLEYAWRKWPEILQADVSWSPWELINLWPWADLVKRVKFGVSKHFLENAWREWPEIWYAAVIPDHLQNWWGYGLLIFLILVLFWLSETGQIWGFRAFSGKPIKEIAWNFVCWCILTTFRTDEIMVTVCWFF